MTAVETARRANKYAKGQHDLACDYLEVGKSPDDAGPTLHEAVVDLKMERDALRAALIDAHTFIQSVGTEDPDDVETMAEIEQLSGRVTAALNFERFSVVRHGGRGSPGTA
jgi:hypothetical protein